MTPLDIVSKEVKKEVGKIAVIRESLLCNRKFRLCLYLVGTIACIAPLCLSLYFLYLCFQSLALASMATIAFGGFGYLAGKICGEIYYLDDVSTLIEDINAKDALKIAAHA